jgi:hypothetical protein
MGLNMKNKHQNYQNLITRKDFLKMATFAVPGLILPNAVLSFKYEPKTEEEAVKGYIAVTRALTHRPPTTYNGVKVPTGLEYHKKRIQAILLVMDKANSGTPFKAGEFENFLKIPVEPDPTPKPDSIGLKYLEGYLRISRMLPSPSINMDKQSLELIGLGLSGASGAFIGRVGVGIAAAGTAFGVKGLMAPDTVKSVSDSMLVTTQNWNDPSFKKVLNTEVKNALREYFGIDPAASVKDHKENLPTEIKDYVNKYENSAKDGNDKAKDKFITDIKEQITKSVKETIDDAFEDQKNKKLKEERSQAQIAAEAEYNSNEKRGAVYLAAGLVSVVGGPEVAKVVAGIGMAADRASGIFDKISAGKMGPIGALAGFVEIAKTLSDFFGDSDTKLIMEAIRKVHESIIVMHKEMQAWFGVVIENQQKMMESINLQFRALYDQNGSNHKEVMQGLDKIISSNITAKDEKGSEGRNNESRQFREKLDDVKRQIDRKIERKAPDQKEVSDAIKIFSSYAIRDTKYGNFTGLFEEKRIEWDNDTIINQLKTVNSYVDNFVGMLPMIVEHIINNGKIIAPINNPIELGKAIKALSIACSIFPDAAKLYGKTNLDNINTIRKSIKDTKQLLQTSISKDVINKLKQQYESVIDKLIDASLKFGDDAAKKINEAELENLGLVKSLNVQAVGPLYKIDSGTHSKKDAAQFTDEIKDNSTLIIKTSQVLEDRKYPNTPYPRNTPYNLGDYIYREYTGLDQDGENKTSANSMDMLNIAERFGIIRKETKSGERVFDLLDESLSTVDHYIDKYSVTKITLLQNEKEVIIGKTDKEGWRISELSLIKPPRKFEPKHIQYFDGDFNDGVKSDSTQPASIRYMDHLVQRINVFHNFRENTIDYAKKYLDNGSKTLDALNVCFKYLAGLKEYLASSDRNLGTQIARGDRFLENNYGFDLPSAKDISNLIGVVTSKEYLYDPKHLEERAKTTIELKQYIKREVCEIVLTSIKEYMDAFFSKEVKDLNLPELNISELMLNTAEQNLKRSISSQFQGR